MKPNASWDVEPMSPSSTVLQISTRIFFPDLLRVELDMKAKGCGIAVTTGIVTKVSAGSVHWGRCEGSTTDQG